MLSCASLSSSLSVSESEFESWCESESEGEEDADDDADDADEVPADSTDETTDGETDSIAASRTLISDYSLSIAPWHGQALGAVDGRNGTGAGIVMQFPFPSLSWPSAHETVDSTEAGIHPPCPSVT